MSRSGILTRSFRAISEMDSFTFARGPRRFNRTVVVRPPTFGASTPPHSTRCSPVGISALPQFGNNFPERNRRKVFHDIGGETLTLVDVFAVPSAGECLDNAG